jgi:uncharacterized membrane protein
MGKAMRTTKDRIRHAILFEIIGLCLVTPLANWLFAIPLIDAGAVSLAGATAATVWNYLYNLLFDHAMLRLRGHVHKTLALRVLHACLFEFGLLLILMAFLAWYLAVSLWQALLLNLSFIGFYLVYAFIYNWVYDKLVPIPDSGPGVRQ